MKRFISTSYKSHKSVFAGKRRIRDTYTHEEFYWDEISLLNRLNEINEEKEYWRHCCAKNSNENSILWNEIFCAETHGVNFSQPFIEYCEKQKEELNAKRKNNSGCIQK